MSVLSYLVTTIHVHVLCAVGDFLGIDNVTGVHVIPIISQHVHVIVSVM